MEWVASFFPAFGFVTKDSEPKAMKRCAAPTSPLSPRATSTASAWAWRTSSTTSSPCSTTPPTARPTPEPSAWSGPASPYPAGRTARRAARRMSSPPQPRGAAGWPPSSTPTPPSPASPRGRPALNSPKSLSRQGSTAARWTETISRSRRDGATSARARQAVMPGLGRIVERPYTADERSKLGETVSTLRRDHLRRLPQRPRLLAQRPRRRLDLQAGRLPGTQEVAVVPGGKSPRQSQCSPRRSGTSPTPPAASRRYSGRWRHSKGLRRAAPRHPAGSARHPRTTHQAGESVAPATQRKRVVGGPNGIRIRVSGLKGQRPSPLDDGATSGPPSA